MIAVVAPWALWAVLMLATDMGILYPSRQDEAWHEAMRRPLSQATATLDDSTSITLHRSACYGMCPDYAVTLYGSGRVEYVGKYFVCEFGERTSTADARAIQRLVDAMLAAELFTLAPQVGVLVMDAPIATTTLLHGGVATRVRHHESGDDPDWLTAAEDEIDLIADTEQWLPLVGLHWQRYCLPADGPIRRVSWDDPATSAEPH